MKFNWKMTTGMLAMWLGFSPVQAGHITHGGDIVLQEFHAYRQEISSELSTLPGFILPLPNFMTAWERATTQTHIELRDKLEWQGFEVIAIVHPTLLPPLIEINTPRWLSYQGSTELKQIVIHEYLPVVGLVDTQYQYSQSLSAYLSGVQNRSLVSLFKQARQENLFLTHSALWTEYFTTPEARRFQNKAPEALIWLASQIPAHSDVEGKNWLQLFQGLFPLLSVSEYQGASLACVHLKLQQSSSNWAQKAAEFLKQKGAPPRLINRCPISSLPQ
ncbi:MAG: hypothetical protein AAGB31_13890 [Bdellovibrio sp.]